MRKSEQLVEEGCLTVNEAAKLMGLGRTKVRELIADGTLAHVRYGRAVRVPRRAVTKYMAKCLHDCDAGGRM